MTTSSNTKYPNQLTWPWLMHYLNVGDKLKGPQGDTYIITQVIPSTFEEYPSLVIKKLETQ